MVRTPAGRSDDDRSNPINAPEHAAYNNLKQSSSSALLGKKLNVPSARDWGENGMAEGEIPPATDAVDDAACAGEKAGAKATMAASNTALIMRIDFRFLSNFDAH